MEPGEIAREPTPLENTFSATPARESFTVRYAPKSPHAAQEITVDKRGGPEGATILTARLELGGRPLTVTLNYKSTFSLEQAKNDMEAALVKAAGLAKILQIGTNTQKVTVTSDQKMVVTKHAGIEEFESVEKGLEKEIEKSETQIKEATVPQTQFEAAARISKIQRFIKTPPVVRRPAEQNLAEFATNLSKARHLARDIEKQEKNKLSFMLNRYQNLYAKLDQASLEEIPLLREQLQEYSLELKKAFDKAEEPLFKQLQEKLVAITNEYNNFIDIKMHTDIEDRDAHESIDIQLNHLQFAIQDCNKIIGQTNLTTNALTIAKSHVMDFGAVVEKKLDLLHKSFRAQGDSTKDSKTEPGGKYDKMLQKAPSKEQMDAIADQLQDFFKGESSGLMTSSEAKSSYAVFSSLKWGKSHLDKALQTPANWTTVRSAHIKTARSGRLYVSVSINDPLLIGTEGGLPAGLLKNKKFSARPLNLFKTTSYILGPVNEHVGEVVSFRGGQFASKESAKKALLEIMSTLPEGVTLSELHINSLLTPFYFTSLKKDRSLLKAHREHLQQAMTELELDFPLTFSNFGVNEGAVGKMKVAGIPVSAKLGWHTSIAEYDNGAAVRLNESLKERFNTLLEQVDYTSPENVAMLDRLGAIGEIGLEMEAIWATNDYADPHVGNNQFKMPALWKTMDALLGIPCYTNCMSGKDRTGKVESNAQENLDEIYMNIADQKRVLEEVFNNASAALRDFPDKQEFWNGFRTVLTAACFKPSDISRLAVNLANSMDRIESEKEIHEFIQDRIKTVQKNLGLDSDAGLLEIKDVPRGAFRANVRGISRTDPKRLSIQDIATPPVAPSSVYGKVRNPQVLLDRQRQAKNRRLNQLTGSLRITQMNTGKPGYKVEGGEPLARFSSGFDRDYVTYLFGFPNISEDDIFDALGMHELPKPDAEKFMQDLIEIQHMPDSKKKSGLLLHTLRKIEHEKMKSLAPQVKVEA